MLPVLIMLIYVWIYLCTCRRSPGPTRAGLWTVWFCSTRWPSGWRMTSPSPLQREYMCMASTSKEQVGTAVAANSLSPSPKSSSRWCRWSGCMPWTMVRWQKKETDLFYLLCWHLCWFSVSNRHWKLIAAIIKCQKAEVQLISSM